MAETFRTNIPGLGLTEISRDGETWHLVMRGVTLESTVGEMIWWGSVVPEGVTITNTLVRDSVLEPGQEEPHDIGYFDMTGITGDAISHMQGWFPQWFYALGAPQHGTDGGWTVFKDHVTPEANDRLQTAARVSNEAVGRFVTRAQTEIGLVTRPSAKSTFGQDLFGAAVQVFMILTFPEAKVATAIAVAVAKELNKAKDAYHNKQLNTSLGDINLQMLDRVADLQHSWEHATNEAHDQAKELIRHELDLFLEAEPNYAHVRRDDFDVYTPYVCDVIGIPDPSRLDNGDPIEDALWKTLTFELETAMAHHHLFFVFTHDYEKLYFLLTEIEAKGTNVDDFLNLIGADPPYWDEAIRGYHEVFGDDLDLDHCKDMMGRWPQP
jgi:hypothetical protein